MNTTETLQQKSAVFDRNDTKAIKGVAVTLMLFHHLAALPQRAPVGFAGFESLLGEKFLQELALGATLSASFFFFLGGYGLFIKWKSSKLSITNTILGLYRSYWKVFLIFVPIAFLFFVRSGEGVSYLAATYALDRKRDYITVAISDFTAWSSALNHEWWFLKSYLCVIPMGYLFCKATRKHHDFWVDLFLVFGIDILINEIFPNFAQIAPFQSLQGNVYYSNFLTNNALSVAFFAGIVFAKYDGIRKIKDLLRRLPCSLALCCAALAALILCKLYITGDDAGDILYCAVTIPVISVILDKLPPLKKIAVYLGKHSTNMWLIHSFYCYYFLEITKIVYCTQNVWIDLFILVALSLVSSIAVDWFWKNAAALGNRLRGAANE